MSRLSLKVQLRDRLAGGLFGFLLLWGAALSAVMAKAHADLLGHICGAGPIPHCGWCYAAPGLALAGLTVLSVSGIIRSPARA